MPEDRLQRVRRVLWFVLAANLFVVVVKLIVGLRAGSLAVLGDAAHSGVGAALIVVHAPEVTSSLYNLDPSAVSRTGFGRFDPSGTAEPLARRGPYSCGRRGEGET